MDRPKRSCIAVLVPEYIQNESYFYSDIFWSLEHEAREEGYVTLMLGISKEAEQQAEMPVISDEFQILGCLTIGIIQKKYMATLHALGKPIVSVDIHHNTLPISTIGTDNIGGAYMAVDYLIKSGHKDIGFIGPIYMAQSVYERWCGFHQAIMDAHLSLNDEYCILGAREEKVSELVTPPLTTVDVDRQLIGKTAVRHLLDIVAEEPSRPYIHSLTCKLIIRDSVRILNDKE